MGAPKTTIMTSDDTAHVLQEMAYVGGMSYARTRLQDATGSRASGKGKRVQPPGLLAQAPTTALAFFITLIQSNIRRDVLTNSDNGQHVEKYRTSNRICYHQRLVTRL